MMGYFAYHLVEGDRGVKTYFLLQDRIERAERIDRELQRRRVVMEHRIHLLRAESLDPDLLSERAMIVLGLVHPDDRLVVR